MQDNRNHRRRGKWSLTAFHLVWQNAQARVILIDEGPEFGLGLVYSTPSLRHLLNVPPETISALPDQPDHFLNWLRKKHDPTATEKTFAPRAKGAAGVYTQQDDRFSDCRSVRAEACHQSSRCE